MKTKILTIFTLLLFSLSFASAVVISDLSQGELLPGEQVGLTLSIKNTLDRDVEDVSLNLILGNTQFISIGGSEDSVDNINDGRSKLFTYTIKASQDIEPGDYNIPYEISYFDTDKAETFTKEGSIGLVVSARTELDFSVEAETNVVGEQGRITLKIINTGFGDIKFVNVEVSGQGFTLISSNKDYIGSVDSDDFESTNFDVMFDDEDARLFATIKYKDFNNKAEVISVDLPVTVYSREKGIELGIIKKNNTRLYGIGVLVLIVVWFTYRRIKKKQKQRRNSK